MEHESDAYALLIAQHLLEREREMDRRLRALLYLALLELAPLIAALPNEPMSRSVRWRALRPTIYAYITPLSDALNAALNEALLALEPLILALATARISTAPPPPPRPLAAIRNATRVPNGRLALLFNRPPRPLFTAPAPSAFDRQLYGVLDRLILGATAPSATLATTLLNAPPTPPTTRAPTRPRLPQAPQGPGSVFSNWRHRINATISHALWSQHTDAATRAWTTATSDAPEPEGWRWNAVLDPATCPYCRRRDGETHPTLTAFGDLPPAHARCRCIVIPIGAQSP